MSTVSHIGFLDRFRATTAAAQLPPGRFAPLPEDGFVRVVGESYCQPALAALRDKCVPGVEGRPSFPAALVPEPDNPHDRHAIAVVSETGRLGYLPRDTAQAYGRSMRALQAAGYEGGSCTALLNGGGRNPPNYGVVLALAYPEECERHLGVVRAGVLRGRHFTQYASEVKALRRSGDDVAAEQLLLELVDTTEAEAREEDCGVAPWYYEQLAIIYRKREDPTAEISILERYERAPHAPGAGPAKLHERLDKARRLA